MIKDYLINFEGRELSIDLIQLDTIEFDVIIGMDWMSTYHASIDCHRKRVIFRIPGEPEFEFQGDSTHKGMLAVTQGEEAPSLEDIPVARDFPKVFLEDLPGLPPLREIDFCITLVPGSAPVSKAPYRMAPMELRELKID